MSHTTIRLLKSVQPPGEAGIDAVSLRQRNFELVSQLSKDLKRWLLSVQHDLEAVNEALALVEDSHTKILRGQPLELDPVALIPLDDSNADEPCLDEEPGQLRQGQWFILDTGNSAQLRATLVLRMDDQQQLLFANQAGIKVQQKSFAEFAHLLSDGKVTLLDSGASFSRSLAHCVGVVTEQDIDELTGVAARKARRAQEQRQKAEQERARHELDRAERDRAEQERQKRKQEGIAQLQREQEQAERLQREREQAARLKREQARQDHQRLLAEQAEAGQLQTRWEEVSRRYSELAARGQQTPQPKQAQRKADGTDLNLARGTWLGFRDNDEAVLAKLAVYNRAQDHYIFVDTRGVKLRELGGKALFLLIARGVADILESRSRFRDEVAEARNKVAD